MALPSKRAATSVGLIQLHLLRPSAGFGGPNLPSSLIPQALLSWQAPHFEVLGQTASAEAAVAEDFERLEVEQFGLAQDRRISLQNT